MEVANSVRPAYSHFMGPKFYRGRKPKPRYSVHFLREWRERHHVERKELAAQTGLSVQTIGRIENRQIQLTQETIDLFARVLRIPRGAIFERPK